jgi:type IV pilus assembly protein PilN
MSRLNLVPWRERQRQTVMRRWQIGGLLAAATTVTVVSAIDHGVAHANKSHEAMMAALQQQQQTLQQQLQEAPLWQARYRQAQQVQQLWPHWQQQQWQALRAYTQLSSVAVRGVQVRQMEWRDGQWRLEVNALSSAHVLRWQAQLQALGIALKLQPTLLSSHLWRCPHGRLWQVHTYELSSPAPREVSS